MGQLDPDLYTASVFAVRRLQWGKLPKKPRALRWIREAIERRESVDWKANVKRGVNIMMAV